jgi:hypothetical protein
MNDQTIEVVIDTKGGITIESKGFAGAECQKATAFLEEALGKVKSDTRTAEFHKHPPAKEIVSR